MEDTKGVRHFIKQILSKNGYKVFEAASARKAREIFNREKAILTFFIAMWYCPTGPVLT